MRCLYFCPMTCAPDGTAQIHARTSRMTPNFHRFTAAVHTSTSTSTSTSLHKITEGQP